MQRPKNFISEPFDYHEVIELRIDTLTNLGVGLGRINDWVVMVPFTLPGELVQAKVYRNAKNYSDADLVKILEASSSRTEPGCSLFQQCGGCQYQHMNYDDQLNWKSTIVKELMERLAGIKMEVNKAIGSPEQYKYRSKLTPHYPKPGSDDFPIGFLKHGSRRSILDVPQCPIATDAINEALTVERQSLPHALKNKKKKRGGTLLLRHTLEGVTTDPTATVSERINDIVYQFQAGEFFQNNPFILPLLLDYALEQAKSDETKYLIDAYCGVGVFSLAAHKLFEQCLGIEVNANAIKWANANAAINTADNCEFIIGEAENIFEHVTFNNNETAVIIDPPRKGCDQAFLNQLIDYNPKRLVYVSCAPDTQARDLKILIEANYEIVDIQPFDLFPQTRHIENVVSMVRAD